MYWKLRLFYGYRVCMDISITRIDSSQALAEIYIRPVIQAFSLSRTFEGSPPSDCLSLCLFSGHKWSSVFKHSVEMTTFYFCHLGFGFVKLIHLNWTLNPTERAARLRGRLRTLQAVSWANWINSLLPIHTSCTNGIEDTEHHFFQCVHYPAQHLVLFNYMYLVPPVKCSTLLFETLVSI